MEPSAIPNNEFLPAILEAERRPIRISQVEVIDHTEQFRPDILSLGSPGTMTVFVGRKGTGAIEDVRDALARRGDITKVLLRLQRYTLVRSDQALVELMIKQEIFADIRYGGEVLNRGIFLPEGFDLVLTVFPYNGGRLARDGFSLVEHYTEGSDGALTALVVQVSPALTGAERAALSLVPEDQLALNVGSALFCKHTTWWAVGVAATAAFGAAVAVTVGAAVAIAALGAVVAPSEEVHLTSEEINQLGPAGSARTLLARRHELLLRNLS